MSEVHHMGRYHFVFPRWSNLLLPAALIVGLTAPLYVVLMVAYGFSPKTTDVGYQPTQPVPFSHLIHSGELGIDCRYCHVGGGLVAFDHPADPDLHELPQPGAPREQEARAGARELGHRRAGPVGA